MYDPNDDHGVYGVVRDQAVGVLGGETIVTEGGRYGHYHFIDEQGQEMIYRWARRDTDYGHRQFATLAECRRYAETGLG